MKFFTRVNTSTAKHTVELYRHEMRRDKKAFVIALVTIPLGNFLYVVLLPLLISFIVQALIEQPAQSAHLWWLVGSMVVASVMAVIIQHFGFIALFNHQERVTTRLAERAMRGLLRHSSGFFANQKVGSLAGDVNTFSRSYMSIMDTMFLQAATLAVSFITSLIIIAFIAPVLLLPLTVLTVLIVAHSTYSIKKRSVYRNKRKEMQSKLFGSIADIIGNQVLVRMFGTYDQEVRSIVRERQDIEKVATKEIVMLQSQAEVRQSILFVFQIATVAGSIYFFMNGMVTIGALIFTITYLGRITGSMFNITSIIRTTEQAFLDASKVTEILYRDIDVVDVPNAKPLHVTRGSIDIKDVGFSYEDGRGEAVFEHLSLTIPAGQSVGLVGKSGGGKSTVTQLLLRYMDIQAGEILIDDQDISRVKQDSLRSHISYVPQDPYLFHRSLRDNIAYGKKDASDADIIDAITKAHAKEFIDKLPNGLDTIVGERGVKLSGGQRQRVAIARAILKNAPILLLDEATSALDSESEALIQSALEHLMKNRTSIVIAHRLSTIAKLDRIIVLDEGKIVEDGTHAELLRRNGTYAKLWNHQSGGFIED